MEKSGMGQKISERLRERFRRSWLFNNKSGRASLDRTAGGGCPHMSISAL
jgi:hypothetical protein